MPGVKGRSGGRNKLSAGAHVIKGTFRRDRHGDDSTPEPPKGRPEPPMALSGTAKAEWNRMVDRLTQNGTLSVVDDGQLFEHCQLFEETQALREGYTRLRKHSKAVMRIAKTLEGQQLIDALKQVTAIEHEIARLSTKLRQGHLAVRVFLVECGLTPSARTRVKVIGGGAETPQSKVDQFRRSKGGA